MYIEEEKDVPMISMHGFFVKQAAKPLRVFSRKEQIQVSRLLLDQLTSEKMGILLCLFTGLRVGEICALTWGDVDFLNRKLHVSKTLQRIQMPAGENTRTKVCILSPKSPCSVRDIPIPEDIFKILKEYKGLPNCYLLTGTVNFMEPRTLQYHFRAIMHKCGLEWASMHTCRHTFATRCIELGFDMKTLSEILGHSNVSITMNRYVHPSMEIKQQNMDRLSALLID